MYEEIATGSHIIAVLFIHLLRRAGREAIRRITGTTEGQRHMGESYRCRTSPRTATRDPPSCRSWLLEASGASAGNIKGKSKLRIRKNEGNKKPRDWTYLDWLAPHVTTEDFAGFQQAGSDGHLNGLGKSSIKEKAL